jgi:two-component system, chemotaxis family, chemotaxis protein CheY
MQGARAEEIKQRLRSLKVLIVDDNACMRKIVRDLLSELGIRHTVEAADGIVALGAIRKAVPDLVILDLDMPFLNGFGFVRIVRTPSVFPYSDLPIIMLSGYGERSHVLEAERLGVNEFLRKPVSAKALFQRIVSVVMKPRALVLIDGCYRLEPRNGKFRSDLAAASGSVKIPA